MRRTRKPRVVWLPCTNSQSAATDLTSSWSIASVPIAAADGGSGDPASLIEVPIVQDGIQSDPLGANSSLADIENSGYRLRRIVGKLYVFIAQTQDAFAEDLWGVTAGFMVRKVDPATGGSLATAASATTNFDLIDPSNIRNNGDPWIWQRSWMLSNYFTGLPLTPARDDTLAFMFHSGAGANYGRHYPGGNAEGPHVDQKTARIVGPEERLFLNVAAQPIITDGIDTSLVIIYNFRVLASMRSNIGNRRNATR